VKFQGQDHALARSDQFTKLLYLAEKDSMTTSDIQSELEDAFAPQIYVLDRIYGRGAMSLLALAQVYIRGLSPSINKSFSAPITFPLNNMSLPLW